jgi:hypothetical protein
MKKAYDSKFFLVLDYYLLAQLEKDFPIDISDFIVFTYILFTGYKTKNIDFSNKIISGHTRIKIHSVKKALVNLEEWGLIVVTRSKNPNHNFKIDRIINIAPKFMSTYKMYDDYKTSKLNSRG